MRLAGIHIRGIDSSISCVVELKKNSKQQFDYNCNHIVQHIPFLYIELKFGTLSKQSNASTRLAFNANKCNRSLRGMVKVSSLKTFRLGIGRLHWPPQSTVLIMHM